MKRPYLALYGNTAIKKAWCDRCQAYSFVINDKLVCCSANNDKEPLIAKREFEPRHRRRYLTKAMKEVILREQDYKCLYCDQAFGSVQKKRDFNIILEVEWDHRTPYIYSQNNKSSNFAAACKICNRLKSSFVFRNLEDAKKYLSDKRKEKGYNF